MQIKTVSPLKEWKKLKFWSYYQSDIIPALKAKGNNELPSYHDRFKALEMVSPDQVKIVILGQDPYSTKGHANGLAFSVYPHVSPIPASLRNIFEEYQSDLGFSKPSTGDLSSWAHRGILLLNSCLTVEEGKPGSHKNIGWERLAFEIFTILNGRNTPIAFILWGTSAGQFAGRIDNPAHLVITSPHPSPFSAGTGFFGSKPFSKAAEHLGVNRDIWKLP